jgi:glycosyl transferase family 1
MTSVPLTPAPPERTAAGRSIVLISHVPPWPAAAGNEYRLARLIDWLGSADFDVHFVYRPFRDPPPDHEELRELAQRFPRLYTVDPARNMITFSTDVPKAHAAMSKLQDRAIRDYDQELLADGERLEPRVLELGRSFAPNTLIDVVVALTAAVRPIAVIAQYIFMSRILLFVPRDAMRVLDLIDVFSSKLDKVLRFGVADTFAVSREDEAYLLARADIAIAIQPEEAEAVRMLVPGLRVVTAGIDFPVRTHMPAPVGKRVLVVGSDNPMNKSGLSAFVHYAWPTILRRVPDAELAVVGSIGTALSGAEPGVALLGRVDDISEVYASSRVAINPAVAGTGVKVKTLEAIAHLRPIVVWPSGAEGLAPQVRAACSIATDWSMFAGHVIDLLTRSEKLDELRAKASSLEAALSADSVYSDLRDALAGARVPAR